MKIHRRGAASAYESVSIQKITRKKPERCIRCIRRPRRTKARNYEEIAKNVFHAVNRDM